MTSYKTHKLTIGHNSINIYDRLSNLLYILVEKKLISQKDLEYIFKDDV
jgi:hypothetical protein